nr:RsmB/NOP family class I SAM-dependent RNA methyltransferase [Hoeflea marina]
MARKTATRLLTAVIDSKASLDGLLDHANGNPFFLALPEQDRMLVRAMLLVTLRHMQVIDAFIDRMTEKPLPAGARSLRHVLAIATSQILYLDVPNHAAVDLAVTQASEDPRSRRFASLVNAVLRRMIREKDQILPQLTAGVRPFPGWFADRIAEIHGAGAAPALMAAMSAPPALDLTVKSDPALWAERLGGVVLPTGTVRIAKLGGPVSSLQGYDDGAWWVQDAAASIPARLFGDLAGRRVADLCAAPGGKTAQLVMAGADVVAFDQSANRLERLQGNLERLRLTAETRLGRAQDVDDPAGFDAILLDAPCSSTGTVRRHPDIPWTKSRQDIERLAVVQRQLLDASIRLLRPDGELVFSNCSLDPEEGEDMIARFLAETPGWRIRPVTADLWPGMEDALTPEGAVRTHAGMLPNADPQLAGLDGFYAVVLTRLPI